MLYRHVISRKVCYKVRETYAVPGKIANVNKTRPWRGVTARVGRYLARSNSQYAILPDAKTNKEQLKVLKTLA